ncbi:MAG: nuclear transport factor 2 family protein [Bryobacterales bacterium]|nr:nuclear transport factor 2 family protein [Bryobacterales bacterium]
MRRALILLMAAASVLAAASVEDQIKEAEKAWSTAVAKNDFAALEKVLSDDLMYVHSNGEADSKKLFIDNLKNKVRTYHGVTYDSMTVKVSGNVALLAVKGGLDVTTRGARNQVKVAFLHTFVKKGSQWQLLGHQSARLQ